MHKLQLWNNHHYIHTSLNRKGWDTAQNANKNKKQLFAYKIEKSFTKVFLSPCSNILHLVVCSYSDEQLLPMNLFTWRVFSAFHINMLFSMLKRTWDALVHPKPSYGTNSFTSCKHWTLHQDSYPIMQCSIDNNSSKLTTNQTVVDLTKAAVAF